MVRVPHSSFHEGFQHPIVTERNDWRAFASLDVVKSDTGDGCAYVSARRSLAFARRRPVRHGPRAAEIGRGYIREADAFRGNAASYLGL
jgi:hypothetical protein